MMESKKILILLLILFVLLFCNQCDILEYQSTAIKYTEIDTTSMLIPAIDFNNLPDSGLIWGNAFLVLETDRVVFSYDAYVDGVFSGSNQNITYWSFNTRDYSDGYHTLKFVLNISTGTKSLADLLNLERTTTTIEKTIEIDNSLPPDIYLNPPVWGDNKLNLTWSIGDISNFQYYTILRYSHYYGGYKIDTIGYIKDKNIINFIDSTAYPIYGDNVGTYRVLVTKHTGFKESNPQNINCGKINNNIWHQYYADPQFSPDGDIIYSIGKNYDLNAISVETDEILSHFSAYYSYDPAFTLNSNGTRAIVLNDLYNKFYVLDTENFTLLKTIDAVNAFYFREGPLCGLSDIFIGFNYRQAQPTTGFYSLNINTNAEKPSSDPIYLRKIVCTANRHYLYNLIPFGLDGVKCFKYEIMGDSSRKIMEKEFVGDWVSYYDFEISKDEKKIFIFHERDRINIVDAENFNDLGTLIVTDDYEVDYIYDISISENYLFVSYQIKKDQSLTMCKVVSYLLSDFSKQREWYFKDRPFTILCDPKERYLYSIVGGAYRIPLQ